MIHPTKHPQTGIYLCLLESPSAQTGVAWCRRQQKYKVPRGDRPGQTWRSFLRNHTDGIAAMDFLVAPTASFRLLCTWAVLRHDRRQLVSFCVMAHPSAGWVRQQINVAFPRDTVPT